MNESIQYVDYIKPDWAPPAWVFGPVWSVLYLLIAISFGYVFLLFLQKRISAHVVLPFVLNIFFNILFTPLQFGLSNFLLASLDIILVGATLIWGMSVIWKKAKWVTLINIPYLLWVSFATILQFTVTILNW